MKKAKNQTANAKFAKNTLFIFSHHLIKMFYTGFFYLPNATHKHQ